MMRCDLLNLCGEIDILVVKQNLGKIYTSPVSNKKNRNRWDRLTSKSFLLPFGVVTFLFVMDIAILAIFEGILSSRGLSHIWLRRHPFSLPHLHTIVSRFLDFLGNHKINLEKQKCNLLP